MKRFILALLASSAVTLFAHDYSSLLKKDSQALDQHIGRIDADSKKDLEAWPAEYLYALKDLEAQMQNAGQLEGILAIRKERDRFVAGKQIPEDAIVDSPRELRDLQLATLAKPADIERNRCKRIVAAIRKYAAILNNVKTTLTKRGQIDTAILVSKEIEAAKTRPEFIAAKAVLDGTGIEAPRESAPTGGNASNARPEGSARTEAGAGSAGKRPVVDVKD